jgi:hypothetical protein
MSNKLTFKRLLENLFLIQSSDDQNIKMSHYLCSVLRKHKIPYKIDNIGNIIARKGTLAEGEHYPTLVAHYDTVHDIVSDYKVNRYRTKSGATAYSSPTGIGGDDKVGLAISLWIAITHPRIKLVFTVGEESGCIGANALTPEDFTDSAYLIEPDRRGNTDLILDYMGSPTANLGFSTIALETAEPFGYHRDSGLITDVFTIQELGVDLSAINLSVGYYKPHTSDEYVIYEHALTALKLVKRIISKAGFKKYEHHRSIGYVSRYTTDVRPHALGYINRSHSSSFVNRFYSNNLWGWDDDDLYAENTLDALTNIKHQREDYQLWLDEVSEISGIYSTEFLAECGSKDAYSKGLSPEDFVDEAISELLKYEM